MAARTVTKSRPPRKGTGFAGDERRDQRDAALAARKKRQEEHSGRDDADVKNGQEQGGPEKPPTGRAFAAGGLHPLPGDGRDGPGQDERQGHEDVAIRMGEHIEIGAFPELTGG